MEPAIDVRGLGKQYHIGTQPQPYGRLTESLASGLRGVVRRRSSTRATDGPGKSRTPLWALRDVTFSVEPGSTVGIIGRNGSGKSTLLKLLSRVTEPTSGTALIRGRVGALLEVGTGFHAELTGRENIELAGVVLGMSRTEVRRRFDDIVEFAEVQRFLDTPVKRYSSGMYTRLAFAVAAHLDTEILLVDEVLAVGDAAFEERCLNRITEMGGKGRTVLFVSHNLAAVQRLCSRTLVLSGGGVAHDASTAGAILHYRSILESGSDSVASPSGADGPTVRMRAPLPSSELRSGDPLDVDVSLESPRSVPGCFIDLVVEDAEGRRIVHTRLGDGAAERVTLPEGTTRVRAHLDRVGLRSGAYTVWVVLGVRNGDAVEDHESDRVPIVVRASRVSGIVDPGCTWVVAPDGRTERLVQGIDVVGHAARQAG
jgi:lipopolysaccharide transport system ATP-binding protein